MVEGAELPDGLGGAEGHFGSLAAIINALFQEHRHAGQL
jgi:hypothetical protein